MPPKITVLTTVYNGQRYLKACMDSVLNQTYPDFEFLIVDDCSTDFSRDIIASYKDNRIRLIENNTNLGQIKSLNIGLDHARAEYVARIDQDDMMMRNRLEKQARFLDRNTQIAVAGTWAIIMDDNGRSFGRIFFPKRNEQIVGAALFGGYFLMHPSVMFRKDVVIKVGKYNEKFSYAEDYDLWTRLLLQRYRLANIPEYLTKFRYHDKSSSRQFLKKQQDSAREIIRNFIGAITKDKKFDSDGLCDILINAGYMRIERRTDSTDSRPNDKGRLLEDILRYMSDYFDMKTYGVFLAKRIFCNRILNFIYEVYRERKVYGSAYLFCIKNYAAVWTNLKLYLYPLRAVLLS